jgi:hypothetical protein
MALSECSETALISRSVPRDRTASQKAHQTGMGKRSIALQKPLNALPGRCRLGQ